MVTGLSPAASFAAAALGSRRSIISRMNWKERRALEDSEAHHERDGRLGKAWGRRTATSSSMEAGGRS
jgi:hypothetical protein